jgi:hypothetical protein
MTNEHPITPPPELVHQWAYALSSRSDQSVFTEVAQWGAGQEREAMLAELKALHLPDGYAAKLRAARRPKPPSLKEQLIGIQPTPTSPSSLRTMQNDLPENVFPISYAPTEESGNKKGDILWYANGHGWYISKWNLGYMSQTTHWTYMPEDKEINSEPEPADDARRLTLVERVADAIGTADDEGLTNMTWNYHALAAIREVAAWINECEGLGNAVLVLKAQDDTNMAGWKRGES